MARKKKHSDDLSDATAGIDRIEAAVCYRTVTRPTGQQVLDWLYPKDIQRLLIEAKPLARELFTNTEVRTTVGYGPDFHVLVRTEFSNHHMLTPHQRAVCKQEQHEAPILECVEKMYGIVREFKVLRDVVNWMVTNKCSLGAAKYYFPGFGSLLDPSHRFHMVERTTRFTEPTKPIGDIAEKIRAAQSILVKGLLCPLDPITDPCHISFSLNTAASPATTITWSQRFDIAPLVA